MLALSRCGRQVEALSVFSDIRSLLRREYGLDPGPALQQVESEILVGNEGRPRARTCRPPLRLARYGAVLGVTPASTVTQPLLPSGPAAGIR